MHPASLTIDITFELSFPLQPIYHPLNDCGDHVVVINSKDVALIGREWQLRVYFHHVGYPKAYGGGPKWIPAWLLHSRD